ncbi:transglycosylase domain-containing protein [Candidatus Daviesbacteria bacterium]|nr:transglycosylase domain-containing protein [Candidatus Daviesbacteria bacterium]
MPRGLRKKASFKPSPTSLAVSLVKFILSFVGSIPINLFKIIVLNFQALLKSLKIPKGGLIERKRGRPKKFHLSRRSKIIFITSASLVFIASYTAFILTAAYQLPTPTRLTYSGEPLTTEFYDRNGNLLYRLYEGKNRTLIKLTEVPKELIQATIATEDKNFYQHIGIDIKAILRALYANYKTGSMEGASTLTQQLIKNSLLTPEKSYVRKAREAILALWTERIYTKDQILQMYLNEAPYGGTVTGIAAAAQTYFGQSPSQLNLAQSAYLAGLPASPTQFSPYGTTSYLAKQRQKDTLEKMVKEGYITQAQADEAYAQDLKLKPPVNNILAPHFVFYIKDLLAEKYGPRVVSQGGLKIYTTLDLQVQSDVEGIVSDEINKLNNLNVQNGAAMVTDAKTGQILAMTGSRDYRYPGFGNYNVTLSLRQPGSSVKPITYATAFKNGFGPASMILDIPVTFRDEWGNAYSPVNYDGTFRGPVTLRQALGSSLNIPAVKLLATLGIDPVVETARDLGITTFDNPKRFGLALTLGAADVKMIEMMGVYGAFSQMGEFQPPTGILKVTDSAGNVLEQYQNSPKQALSPGVAYLITNILSDDNARKMAFGANSLLNIPGFQVAVKTGTSDLKKDNWTFGYTPKFVVGVWVGNPDNSPMNPALTSGITGAAPIWNKIIHSLIDKTTPLAFEQPAGITEVKVGGKKDIGITEAVPKALVRVTKKEDKLFFTDSFSTYATSSAQANPTQPNL